MHIFYTCLQRWNPDQNNLEMKTESQLLFRNSFSSLLRNSLWIVLGDSSRFSSVLAEPSPVIPARPTTLPDGGISLKPAGKLYHYSKTKPLEHTLSTNYTYLNVTYTCNSHISKEDVYTFLGAQMGCPGDRARTTIWRLCLEIFSFLDFGLWCLSFLE